MKQVLIAMFICLSLSAIAQNTPATAPAKEVKCFDVKKDTLVLPVDSKVRVVQAGNQSFYLMPVIPGSYYLNLTEYGINTLYTTLENSTGSYKAITELRKVLEQAYATQKPKDTARTVPKDTTIKK